MLSKPVRIDNLPDIEDIKCFLQILENIGARIEYINNNSVIINPSLINNVNIDVALGSKIRGSYYLLGALLSKFKKAFIPYPGGCNIGNRPMDLHITALQKIGVIFKESHDGIFGELHFSRNEGSINITLPFPSRGATINTILTSVLLADQKIIIINANKSPETDSLIEFLKQSGLNITRDGDDIVIIGSKELKIDKFEIIPDKIEVATLLSAGLVTKGDVSVRGVIFEHIRPFLDKLKDMGYKYVLDKDVVSVYNDEILKPIKIISGLEYLCIDADFEPILSVLLCRINGDSIIEDTINPDRHSKFLIQLMEMGAKITIISNTRAVIHGKVDFASHDNLICHDIRGGVALILAALVSDGVSRVSNMFQVNRGYENLDQKLIALGAEITEED